MTNTNKHIPPSRHPPISLSESLHLRVLKLAFKESRDQRLTHNTQFYHSIDFFLASTHRELIFVAEKEKTMNDR